MKGEESKKKAENLTIAFGLLHESSVVSPRMYFVLEGGGEGRQPAQNLERNTNEGNKGNSRSDSGDSSLGSIRGARLRAGWDK